MEECAEVIHASSKVLKRGRHGVEKEHLSEEIGDVEAIIELMKERGLLHLPTIQAKKEFTKNKYKELYRNG